MASKLSDHIALLAKIKPNRYKIQRAENIIRRAIAKDGNWSLSFSGGKDSTVMLDLVRKQASEIDIIWFDDGWDYPETLIFIDAIQAQIERQIFHVPFPITSRFWKKEIAYGGDNPEFDHIGNISYKEWRGSYNGSFIGMRKEESTIRYLTFQKRGPLYFHKELKHWHCCPLYDWTYQDIWGYIGVNNLAYNPAYDRLFSLGIPLEMLRVGPLTAWMVWQYGALATLKRGWPDLFNRFVEKFPEARSYT